jgi:hypothetical protein
LSEVSARVQTVLQVGSSDITAMMVQSHIEALQKEEADILAEHKADMEALGGFCDEIYALFAQAFAAKKPVIDALAAAINALAGGRPIYATLDPNLTRTEQSVAHVFSNYFSRRMYGGVKYPFLPFDRKSYDGSWMFVREKSPEAEEAGEPEFEAASVTHADDDVVRGADVSKVHHLRVDIPADLRERINAVLRHNYDLGERLDAVRAELKDIPNLERKVSAALTKQLIATQPDILRQVNAALVSSGGKLLVEVQGPSSGT